MQGRYSYKYKPVGQKPYAQEEHYARIDHGGDGYRIAVIKIRKGRDGWNVEISEMPFEKIHDVYHNCPDTTQDVFADVVEKARTTLSV